MTRRAITSFGIVCSLVGTGLAGGQEASPVNRASPVQAEAAPTASTVAPVPGGSSAARARLVSPEIAARLAAGVPKYEPLAIPASPPAEPGPDLREIDRPRNTIVRLPPYLVPDRKPPPMLKEREIQTPRARLELALKTFPGARLGSFWIFNNHGIALAMLAEEERLERKREFEDLVSLMWFSDPAEQTKAKEAVDQAFVRRRDFGR